MVDRSRCATLSTLALLTALTHGLAGCGSSGSSPTAPTTVLPTTSAVARVTTIDVNLLANYARPVLPVHYDGAVNALDNQNGNPAITDAVATLGRVLFYDRELSTTRTIACASCHKQAAGFGDTDQFSSGVAGRTSAHSMRLGNVRYFGPGNMFWNRRAASIEAQATEPVLDAAEMGWRAAGGLPALVARLQALDYYQELFTLAYGSPTVTEDRLRQSIAQFERAMISSSSRWDSAYALVLSPGAPNRGLNLDLPGFSDSENRGRQIFMGNADCSQCHVPPTFALAPNAQGIGLDAGETTAFKAPSLKNVARSGRFMHDGRFASLEQVIDHYSGGIQLGPALDNRLRRNGGPRRLNFTAAERADLVAFLRTLTDDSLVNDARFSNPFRQ